MSKWLSRLSYEPVHGRLSLLAQQIKDLGMALGKAPVEIDVRSNDVRLPRQEWSHFGEHFVHIIRNVADHGLETPQERHASAKDPHNQILIEVTQTENEILIKLKDDGRGIDWNKIRESAKSANLPFNTREDLSEALFADGVSSQDEVSMVSGRGLGLASLKQCCDDMHGAVKIESEPGQGTSFIFSFPAELPSQRSA